MKRINKIDVRFRGIQVGTLSLTSDMRQSLFEYDRNWLINGFSISPLELPLKKGIFIAKPEPFKGGFGIFEDSLPDGYGRYLLHKALLKLGRNSFDLSILEKLSIIGSSGMGALTYHPAETIVTDKAIDNFDELQKKALEVLSELQTEDIDMLLFKSGNSGGARPKAIFEDQSGHWLVKFRHTYDPQDMGIQEFKYNELAKECGITIPDFKLVNDKYFATRRFDITHDGERVHVATAGGLMCIPLGNPILDYSNLLALTGWLTQNPKDVEEMYRRMIFNYIMGNKDDHCKNFSFLVLQNKAKEWKWQLAPAYDLTFCAEGYNGEHATSVNGSGTPTITDFIKVGTDIRIPESKCRTIIDTIKSICKNNEKYLEV